MTMSFCQSNGFRNVAVIGYYDRAIVKIQPSVIEQMNGKIDVRALLFRLYNFGKPGA